MTNADHYRLFRQVGGVDADFVHAETVNDSEGTSTGLPTVATVRIRVTAVIGP